MKIIANGGVIQISLEGRGNLVHDFWTAFNSFKRVLGQYERTDENRERERENVQQTLNHGGSRMHANTKRNWMELEKGEGRIKPIPRRLSQS